MSLTEDGGKPADTLMNVVALIATRFRTDVCSAYLLEPDRSNLVLAATLGLHPSCIGTLRMPLSEGLAGLVAEQVRARARCRRAQSSALQILQGVRRRGVPLLPRRAAHRSRRAAGRADRPNQGGAHLPRRRDSHAGRSRQRRLRRSSARRAPSTASSRPAQERLWALARNLWWSWDHDCVSLFRDLNPTRWRQLNQNPISLLSEMPLGELERRATELVLHSRINYVYRRQQEYLNADRTWGAQHAGVLRPRPVAYFSAEFGLHESLPIYSGGLGVLAGDHIKSASDLDIPLVGIGLFYGQGYFLQRLDINGWQQEEYLQTDVNQLPMQPAIGANGEPVVVEIRNARRLDPRQGLAREGGPLRSAAARFQRRRQCARRSRAHFAPLRRRRPHAHPPGAAARRRRLSRAARPWASRPACCISTKATAASPSSRRFAAAWRKRASTSTPRPARFPAKSSSPRTRPCPPATTASSADLIEEHLGPLRDATRPLARSPDGLRPRELHRLSGDSSA